nr:pollen-specific leucine-rich repeat extensin-like protein 1 [Lolium perenne]
MHPQTRAPISFPYPFSPVPSPRTPPWTRRLQAGSFPAPDLHNSSTAEQRHELAGPPPSTRRPPHAVVSLNHRRRRPTTHDHRREGSKAGPIPAPVILDSRTNEQRHELASAPSGPPPPMRIPPARRVSQPPPPHGPPPPPHGMPPAKRMIPTQCGACEDPIAFFCV